MCLKAEENEPYVCRSEDVSRLSTARAILSCAVLKDKASNGCRMHG